VVSLAKVVQRGVLERKDARLRAAHADELVSLLSRAP
jgi:hypothetical protein